MIHIIDDDLHILSMLTETMEILEHPAVTFSCPSDYCEYASSSTYHQPDIIITDVKMPKLSGYQLMRKVSEMHKEIKFIIMTGYQEVKDKCSEHPHIFMQKPFNLEKLDMHIQQLLADA
ncbi:MAG: response regulator [Mariprofundaceae bacterium]|nr:response regulator [Mariprofundaceae bacterium]